MKKWKMNKNMSIMFRIFLRKWFCRNIPKLKTKKENLFPLIHYFKLPNIPDAKYLYEAYNFLNKIPKLNLKIFKLADLALSLQHIDIIRKKANKQKTEPLKNMNLVNIIAKPVFLLYSQRNFKNQKKKALGIDNVLLHGITEKGFIKLAKDIGENIYKPKPIKKVKIPKFNGKS